MVRPNDALWRESLCFLVADELDVAEQVSRQTNRLILSERNQLPCRVIKVVFPRPALSDDECKYAEHRGAGHPVPCKTAQRQEQEKAASAYNCACPNLDGCVEHTHPSSKDPILAYHGIETYKHWSDAPCFESCKAKFTEHYTPRIPFLLTRNSHRYPKGAVFGFSTLAPGVKSRNEDSILDEKPPQRHYNLICGLGSPSAVDIDHIAHLLWHMRNGDRRGIWITKLWTHLDALKWLEAALPLPHQPFPLLKVGRLDLYGWIGSLHNSNGTLDAWIRDLINGHHRLASVSESLNVQLSWPHLERDINRPDYAKNERYNLHLIGDYLVEVFATGTPGPMRFLINTLTEYPDTSSVHCHHFINNQRTGAVYSFHRNARTICASLTDPTKLVNKYCNKLVRYCPEHSVCNRHILQTRKQEGAVEPVNSTPPPSKRRREANCDPTQPYPITL